MAITFPFGLGWFWLGTWFNDGRTRLLLYKVLQGERRGRGVRLHVRNHMAEVRLWY